ncbi:MAG: hypothetical protein EXR07_20420 [Acetobacteraceae bacterium]|nr:hypothetical protein [Acetobacteraceae bacterium]
MFGVDRHQISHIESDRATLETEDHIAGLVDDFVDRIALSKSPDQWTGHRGVAALGVLERIGRRGDDLRMVATQKFIQGQTGQFHVLASLMARMI